MRVIVSFKSLLVVSLLTIANEHTYIQLYRYNFLLFILSASNTCSDIQCTPGLHTCLISPVTSQPQCHVCRRSDYCSSYVNSGKIVCGTDNKTYSSWCDLQQHACNTGSTITTKHYGPCGGRYQIRHQVRKTLGGAWFLLGCAYIMLRGGLFFLKMYRYLLHPVYGQNDLPLCTLCRPCPMHTSPETKVCGSDRVMYPS